MKKTILILLFINSFLSATSTSVILTNYMNSSVTYCVSDFYTDNEIFYFKKCSDNYYNNYYIPSIDSLVITDDTTNEVLLNYEYGVAVSINNNDSNTSNPSKLSDYTLDSTLSLTSDNLSPLGLSNGDLNFNFALSGLLMSFLFLFGILANI